MEAQRRIALDPQGDYSVLLEEDGSLVIQARQEDKGLVRLTAQQAYHLFVWLYDYLRATSPHFAEQSTLEHFPPGQLRHGLDTEATARRSREDWANEGEALRSCFALDDGNVHSPHSSCYVDERNVPCSLRNTLYALC